MIKRLMVVFALIALFASVANAQWTKDAGFASVVADGSTQGVAVDPEGKVWVSNYWADDTLDNGASVRSIRVYKSDGTPASFSPIKMIVSGGGFVVDTLTKSSYGMKAHVDGNILYCTSGGDMFKIDYKTGKGLAKVNVKGGSITMPDVSSDGTIYVASVAPGDPVKMYDADLSEIGTAIDGAKQSGYRRTVAISSDGLTFYDIPFSEKIVYVYKRADQFSDFALSDSILAGWNIESCAWNPSTGLFWASAGSEFDPPTATGVTAGTWYGINMQTMEISDSLKWDYVDSVESASQRPRGIDFTSDGTTAYIGCYGTPSGYPQVQKLVKGATSTVNLTLQVDMSVQIDKGNFTVGTDTIRCAGSMQGWSPSTAPDMTDADGDKVYTTTYAVEPSKSYEYKFVIGGRWKKNEANNRKVDVGTSNMVVDKVFYDNDDGRELKTISVSFQCNMELEIAASRFNPATDTLTARGSATTWGSDALQLLPSVTDPNIYEGATTQYKSFDGDVIYYKFAYTHAGDVNWETNPPTDSKNYEHTVTATDITNGYTVIPVRGYNNSTLATVVNQESVIRFVVDMNGAKDVNGVAFTKVENVAIAGANTPLAWPGGGWPDNDPNVIFLVDDGTNGDATAGDGFFTKEITFPIYTPLKIQYKYGANWGLATNNGINDNEAGVGADHFITLFPGFWYGDAADVFGVMGNKDVVNGVEQIGSGVPSAYQLGQNYPNPFNPSTIINFSIPESGLVTLKVYNVLGQEVAELVNNVKSAGSYEVSFDASNLTTGMYVYKIQAGNYTATKKMMLVK